MHRRAVLGLAGGVAVAGCLNLFPDERTTLAIGERATFDDEVEVTVTDAMTTTELTLAAGTPPQTRSLSPMAPAGEQFALFELTVDNATPVEQQGPQFNVANYELLSASDRTIHARGINDIRVFGSGEGGRLPEEHQGVGYDSLSADGSMLSAYPQSPSGARPVLETDESIGGWVYGLIDADATPELKVRFDGDSEVWTSN